MSVGGCVPTKFYLQNRWWADPWLEEELINPKRSAAGHEQWQQWKILPLRCEDFGDRKHMEPEALRASGTLAHGQLMKVTREETRGWEAIWKTNLPFFQWRLARIAVMDHGWCLIVWISGWTVKKSRMKEETVLKVEKKRDQEKGHMCHSNSDGASLPRGRYVPIWMAGEVVRR